MVRVMSETSEEMRGVISEEMSEEMSKESA